jgi:Ca2+-transporting ATPase
MPAVAGLPRPWGRPADEVLHALEVDPERGLDAAEVKWRRWRYGPNRLREAREESAWRILAAQFKSMIVGLLAVAAALSFAFGRVDEGIAIAAVVAINAAIGFVTELRAVRSMEALRRLGRVTTKVLRDGRVLEVRAEALVPGDIVPLEAGDLVSADLRLIEASKLQADESALTGESAPVGKNTGTLDGEVPLAERRNMVFTGTAVTRGSGRGVVVATGAASELGQVSVLVEEAEAPRTPLERRLDRLGYRLIGVTLAVAALVAVAGILTGKGLFLMVETGIALAVATIPEGLPIVATIALARGMWRMARRNVLINRLSAVETLGATTIICTDKTGTLTENRMTVVRIAVASGEIQVGDEAAGGAFVRDGRPVDPRGEPLLREVLEIGVLCNNAALPRPDDPAGRAVGDPLEVALLAAGAMAGFSAEDLRKRHPEVREEPFDPETKMMATVHEADGRYRVAVKGAPEAVLSLCSHARTVSAERLLDDEGRRAWREQSDRMAAEGLRVLALAAKVVKTPEARPYEDLTLVGLVGLLDPPRRDVRAAVAACRDAGIRVVMVTGDQPLTARRVASAVGLIEDEGAEVVRGEEIRPPDQLSAANRRRLLEARILARVTPRQKLDLVELHQRSGAVVAMTGDGVNDAPALKKADIGVAMGQRGTQVARDAADMVLRDDAFASIVAAVEQGRIIFGNIRAFVLYLLSCNVSEIMVVALGSLVDAPLPVRPLQILFLNLVTDVFPALALGAGEGDRDVLRRPPRDPREPILTGGHWLAVGGFGLLITVAVLGAFALALAWWGVDEKRAVTVSFLTLAFAQLWHVFNMRGARSRLVSNEITRNPFVWVALALCTGVLLAAVYVPGLAAILDLHALGGEEWALVVAMSLLPAILGGSVRRRLS